MLLQVFGAVLQQRYTDHALYRWLIQCMHCINFAEQFCTVSARHSTCIFMIKAQKLIAPSGTEKSHLLCHCLTTVFCQNRLEYRCIIWVSKDNYLLKGSESFAKRNISSSSVSPMTSSLTGAEYSLRNDGTGDACTPSKTYSASASSNSRTTVCLGSSSDP